MLFLPSVNFDYGEMPVMAFLSFLSFSHSVWLQGVGGVEVLIGNCRAHCLHIHGFLNWPASGSKIHQVLQTHTDTHKLTHIQSHLHTSVMYRVCTDTLLSLSAFWNNLIYMDWALSKLVPPSGSDHLEWKEITYSDVYRAYRKPQLMF